MGRVLYFLGFFVTAAILGAGPTASAETFTRSNQITVNAVVLPAHSVIVDDYNQVIKIYSNTNQSATPTFYRLSIDNSTKLIENSDLLARYHEATKDAPRKIGTIYERPFALSLLPPQKSLPALQAIVLPITAPIALAL